MFLEQQVAETETIGCRIEAIAAHVRTLLAADGQSASERPAPINDSDVDGAERELEDSE